MDADGRRDRSEADSGSEGKRTLFGTKRSRPDESDFEDDDRKFDLFLSGLLVGTIGMAMVLTGGPGQSSTSWPVEGMRVVGLGMVLSGGYLFRWPSYVAHRHPWVSTPSHALLYGIVVCLLGVYFAVTAAPY